MKAFDLENNEDLTISEAGKNVLSTTAAMSFRQLREYRSLLYKFIFEKNAGFYWVLSGAVVFPGLALNVTAIRSLFLFSYLPFDCGNGHLVIRDL